jgi:hypothetical protein
MTPSVAFASLEDERASQEKTVDRFAAEFPALDRSSIERCLRDTWCCARHLCSKMTRQAVEQLTHERLMAMAASAALRGAGTVAGPRPAGDTTIS